MTLKQSIPKEAPESHIIRLTMDQCMEAGVVGLKRRLESRFSGRDPGFGGRKDPLGDDIQGAMAEYAYCLFRGILWNYGVNTFTSPDAGQMTQVRSTSIPNGRLIFRPGHDNPNHYYVLVIADIPNFWIVGWIHGSLAQKPDWLFNPNDSGEAFFVPQHALKPFANP